MIGKLRSLASKLQNQLSGPAPAAKPTGMQVRDGFTASSRAAEVRASGPKVLMGMAPPGSRSLGEALVASSLTSEERSTYQDIMEELAGSPHAQEYVKRTLREFKLATLLGTGSGEGFPERAEKLVEEARQYELLPQDARAVFDALLEEAGDDFPTRLQLREKLWKPEDGIHRWVDASKNGTLSDDHWSILRQPTGSEDILKEFLIDGAADGAADGPADWDAIRSAAGVGVAAAPEPDRVRGAQAPPSVAPRIDPNATGGGSNHGLSGDPLG